MSEWVWIVSGGEMSLPAIQEARRRGYKVIVSDGNKDCVGKRDADKFICVDTYDVDANCRKAYPVSRLAKEGIRVVGVLGPGVDVGPTVSALAAFFNTPAVNEAVAANVRDKGTLRCVLHATRPQFDIDTGKGPAHFHSYPCVIKPRDNCATRGVSLVHHPIDLQRAVENAEIFNKQARGVLIEEYLYGEEHALDFFIVDGKAIWVNGTTRLYRTHIPGTHEPLFGIEAAAINPWQPPQEVIDLATYAAEKLGVTEGPFKMDVVKDPRYGWCIYECATRLSGGYDHAFMAPLVGKDITGLLLDYSTGVKLTAEYIQEKTQWNGKYACFYVPYYRPGEIDGWQHLMNIEPAEQIAPNVHYIFRRSETEIVDLKTCADRPLYIIATGNSPLNALRNAGRARKYIQPKYLLKEILC